MIEHYLGLERAQVVRTADFALALENMRYVHRRRAISLFFGDSGVGKSIAAQAVASQLPDGEGCVVKLDHAAQPADAGQRHPRAADGRLARRDAMAGRTDSRATSCASAPARSSSTRRRTSAWNASSGCGGCTRRSRAVSCCCSSAGRRSERGCCAPRKWRAGSSSRPRFTRCRRSP